MDFVKEYWTDVFDPFIADVAAGRTSNPDIQCNRMIKFGAFFRRCRAEISADALVAFAADPVKDQTYFLSQVQQDVLQHTLFPIGHLLKRDVKRIARERGFIDAAERRESMGICFVGPRPFGEFVGEYVATAPGDFVDEAGNVVGRHRGLATLTIGQRAAIAGRATRLFVASKDPLTGRALVVPGRDHALLRCRAVRAGSWNWIAVTEPAEMSRGGRLAVLAKIRAQMAPVAATVMRADGDSDVVVAFDAPQSSVPVGQDVVLYQDSVCLGGGRIVATE
ncbi:hypothetical protein HK105_201752 [Polyrhizophydium stewartii]|uniref:tRNA-5-taurinomethyluridine 2-sulfurtransferase n=1 Tax=Polyrhizophydium stewartii TaxID=2732419 RepID=A0ABR4NHA8_9FUNG